MYSVCAVNIRFYFDFQVFLMKVTADHMGLTICKFINLDRAMIVTVCTDVWIILLYFLKENKIHRQLEGPWRWLITAVQIDGLPHLIKIIYLPKIKCMLLVVFVSFYKN